jgi:hypothetical protein
MVAFVRRLLPLPTIVCLVGGLLLVPAMALANGLPVSWDDGRIVFRAPAGLVVTSETVRAEEGLVDQITVRPYDEERASIVRSSFITITVFRRPLALRGSTRASALQVRDYVLDGMRARLGGAIIESSDASFALGGTEVEGVRWELSTGEEPAQASIAAMQSGPWTVVFYYHRSHRDRAHFGALNEVASTLRFAQR